MTNLTRLAYLCTFLTACGDSGGSDAGNPNGDGGPGADGGGQITSNTAKGVLPGAEAVALEMIPDGRLLRIGGNVLIEGGREVDPAVLQSYWQYSFISPSTGLQVNVTYSQEQFLVSSSQQNPEGLRYADVWIDSNEAIDKLVEAGFVELTDEELMAGWTMSATLAMYAQSDPALYMAPEAMWRIVKTYDEPPLGDPVGEEWLVTRWKDQGGYLVCSPAECGFLP